MIQPFGGRDIASCFVEPLPFYGDENTPKELTATN